MRVAKFCEQNIKTTAAGKALNILSTQHQEVVDTRIVDCFRRCLECRVKPFCRIQLTTVEADDANSLVTKILQTLKLEAF